MTCPNCGTENVHPGGYCPWCGAHVEEVRKNTGTQGSLDPVHLSGGDRSGYGGTAMHQGSLASTAQKKQWPVVAAIAAALALVIGAVVLFGASGGCREHHWLAATCTAPRTCEDCGETEGSANGHSWLAATYSAPKTCSDCGVTEGAKRTVSPVYLNDLRWSRKYGKLWTRSEQYAANADDPTDPDWTDLSTDGHSSGTVRDNQGNVYSYGLSLDGNESDTYYVIYRLDGKYTRFTGVCGCPEINSAVSGEWTYHTSLKYTKYFEVYGDGRLLYTSATMRYDYMPQSFSVDVTGVEELTIQYPATNGPNEIATIFDGRLS